MRASLNEIAQIEQYLDGSATGETKTIVRAKLILNDAFLNDVEAQKQSYEVVRHYGRKKLRKHIQEVADQLFNAPVHRSFQERISSIFSKT
tara:strand:- start:117 stop:389 length:273 start_codon:yes stop_codon:yes gene_type:complete